jgi:hypothetical protein
LLAFGIAGTTVGGLIKPRSTTHDEDYRLAAQYNRKLRRELGLPEDKLDSDVPADAQTGRGF